MTAWMKITGIIVSFPICVHMKANTVIQQNGVLLERVATLT